jgi:hypothetical protein
MISLKRHLLPLGALSLMLTLAVGAGRLTSDERQQQEFITIFYKNYLAYLKSGAASPPADSAYSRDVERLLAVGRRLCANPVQADEICGYGESHILEDLDIDSARDFDQFHLTVTRAGKNTLDVYFGASPEPAGSNERKIRYVLVKEARGWRVDNAYFGSLRGFGDNSIRTYITAENQRTLALNRDITATAKKVFTQCVEPEMPALIKHLIAFPVQVCDRDGICKFMPTGDPQMREAYRSMHLAYHGGPPSILDDTVPLDLSKLPHDVGAVEGEMVTIDALDFTFHHNAWWITKIDLRRIGTTIPTRRHPGDYPTPTASPRRDTA